MTQRILPIDTTHLRLQVLSPEDVKQIHQATLDLIESVGVRFPSERALDILGDHGATIDREAQIGRIPGHVVEEAMSQAPAQYTLCARENRDLDLPLDGGHAYLAVDGTGVEVLDPYTGEKRVSTKGDSSGRRCPLRIVPRRREGSTSWRRCGTTTPNTPRPRPWSRPTRWKLPSKWRRPSWEGVTS